MRNLLRRLATRAAAAVISVCAAGVASASDHLDSPATVADPAADIADVFAWPAAEGRRLNLIMTVRGSSFSDKVEYMLRVDSGKVFGHTSASTSIVCRFPRADAIDCRAGKVDTVSGNPSDPAGIQGRNHLFRVFAALRDDPFYNNVKGLMAAYQAANVAIQKGAPVDTGGCAHFDEATMRVIRDQMQHTDGGPAQNLLYNWTVSAIVITVDLAVVSRGGELLAVSGSTTSLAGKPLDRMARPFVTNTFLGVSPFSSDDASGIVRQQYNETDPAGAVRFIADLQRSLAFQDSLDGRCGNQFLANHQVGPARYRSLAAMFADDRLWVNGAATVCTQFFAVELAHLGGNGSLGNDCGGRTPTYDTSNVWRSVVIAGTVTGITDGLHQDEHVPSASVFPFLAPPDPHGASH